MENPVETVDGAVFRDGYRRLHSLASCDPTANRKHYVSTCICGWESPLHRSYLAARGALTEHVLAEVDKIMEGVQQ